MEAVENLIVHIFRSFGGMENHDLSLDLIGCECFNRVVAPENLWTRLETEILNRCPGVQ